MGLVLPQTVKAKWQGRAITHYISKGYKFTNRGDELEVNVEDLSKGSEIKVRCNCDYCGESSIVMYCNYVKQIAKFGNFSCRKCSRAIRVKQTWQQKTDIQIKEINEKKKQTCRKKYGKDNPFQVEKFKAIAKQTCREKYGKDYFLQTEEGKEKRRQNFKEKYGKDNPSQLEEFKEKQRQTCREKYGKDSFTQVEIFKIKANRTKIKKYGSCFGGAWIYGSSQQKHIFEIVGGKYNYPFHGFFVDIALLKNKIAIEYDGTGHTVPVKSKKMTQEEFTQKEQNKENKLFEEGWKIIRLVNEKTDKLPDDETIVNLINEKIHILKTTDTKKVVVKWS